MSDTSVLTGGTIATIIAVPIILLALAAAAIFFRVLAKRENRNSYMSDYWMFQGPAIGAVALIPVTIAATWWGMYPWKAEYHHWTEKSGVVATVDKRLVSSGKDSMEDKFVVSFQGSDQQYGVLDTRAAGLKPGDHLDITCVRIWQYSGTDGYDCNFVSLQRKP